jgi:hypothetical protein
MLESENIKEKTINTVDIKVFPATIKNGFNLVGKCDTSRGKIHIYPKTFNFCTQLQKKHGKQVLVSFVGNRARATLIHELLHLKYVSDEERVRELTDRYFSVYVKKQVAKNSNLLPLHDLIFDSKKYAPVIMNNP